MKRKKLIGVVTCLMALVLIGGVWAYYTSTNQIDNKMVTKAYGDEMTETFTPKDDWQPGDKANKEVGVTNTGDYDLFVRIKMEESWTQSGGVNKKTVASSDAKFNPGSDAEGHQDSPTDGLIELDGSVVYKELAIAGWVFGNDGYWYYNTKLAPKTETGSLLKSITLVKDADMGDYDKINYYTSAAAKPAMDNIGTDPATQWVAFTGNTVPAKATHTRAVSKLKDGAEGYANGEYVLSITSETIQGTQESFTDATGWHSVPDAVLTNWGVTK